MPRAARISTLVVFLLLLLPPITGALAGGAPCAEECDIECGACSACEPAGPPSGPAEWDGGAGERCTPTSGMPPAESVAARAIEHIPLRHP